jgi:hypothetical protein
VGDIGRKHGLLPLQLLGCVSLLLGRFRCTAEVDAPERVLVNPAAYWNMPVQCPSQLANSDAYP